MRSWPVVSNDSSPSGASETGESPGGSMNTRRTEAHGVAEHFAAVLDAYLQSRQPVCIAYSGGRDSTVLLHLAIRVGDRPVRAVHVDHGLQPASAEWAASCVASCETLGVPLEVLSVAVPEQHSQGPEAAARAARYAALSGVLQPDEVLLTAHHRQDQAETFVLQALRGSGPRGLAAMPVYTEQRGYKHLRPLLDVTSESVQKVAETLKLDWSEDPSNAQLDFDRNFVRHELLPLLLQRWPGAEAAMTRASRLQAEAADLLDALARQDLGLLEQERRVALDVLQRQQPDHQRNLMRYLLRRWDLPIPSEVQLRAALDALLHSAADAQPEAAWPGVRVRRYRDKLWFFPAAEYPGDPADMAPIVQEWRASEMLELGGVRGCVELCATQGSGIAASRLPEVLTIRFRSGGEQIRPAPNGSMRDLKKLLQETGVVPWMRCHIPLVYAGNDLLAVADLWVNAEFAAAPDEPGVTVRWSAHAPLN